MMPTTQDALQHLGIDYADDVVTANVGRALAAATQLLYGTVGSKEDLEKYLPKDPRVTELLLVYADDLYSDRGVVSSKVSNATRRLVANMELQLRLELQAAKEASGT